MTFDGEFTILEKKKVGREIITSHNEGGNFYYVCSADELNSDMLINWGLAEAD